MERLNNYRIIILLDAVERTRSQSRRRLEGHTAPAHINQSGTPKMLLFGEIKTRHSLRETAAVKKKDSCRTCVRL